MQLFWQAFTIMCVGMSLVFLFLFIVVQGINLTALIVRRIEARHAPGDGGEDTTRTVAVIAAALNIDDSKR